MSIILYNIQGEQLSAIQKYNQSSGVYNEIIKIGDYPKGKYILQIVVGNKKYGEKVIKK
nr:T9SS type A sorting domain-containing protein [Bacteroides intestinalis]